MIRDGAILAPKVTILTRTHRYDAPDLMAVPFDNVNLAGDVVIGEASWIGQGTMILPSVKIGRGAVVVAGCVVSKSIPDYAVVAGNPAKIIGWRNKDVFEKLCAEKRFNKNAQNNPGKKINQKIAEKTILKQ